MPRCPWAELWSHPGSPSWDGNKTIRRAPVDKSAWAHFSEMPTRQNKWWMIRKIIIIWIKHVERTQYGNGAGKFKKIRELDLRDEKEWKGLRPRHQVIRWQSEEPHRSCKIWCNQNHVKKRINDIARAGDDNGITTDRIGGIVVNALRICYGQISRTTGNDKKLAPTARTNISWTKHESWSSGFYLIAVKMVSWEAKHCISSGTTHNLET